MASEDKAPRDVIIAYFQAVTDRRFADAAGFLADDLDFHIVGEGYWPLGGAHDRESALAIHRRVAERFPAGLAITVHRILVDGENVAAEIESYGTRVDGRIYNNHYVNMFVVRNGRIVARREYLDTLQANDLLCGEIAAVGS